jgi:hypothetical protein
MTRGALVSPLKRPLGVTIDFACHAVAGLLLALPTLALVAGTGVGRFPSGDRLLFEPGGMLAAEVLRTVAPALPSHVTTTFGAAILLGALLLLPHAALLVMLARHERAPQAVVWARAFARLPALAALTGFALLARTLVLVAAATLAGALRSALGGATTRSADIAYVALVSLGLAVCVAVGIVRDIGRAAIVRDELDSRSALFVGLASFGRAPARALARWLVPALAGLGLVALGAALAALVDVSRDGEFRLWVVFVAHQVIAFALCFLRAQWSSATFGLISVVGPTPAREAADA